MSEVIVQFATTVIGPGGTSYVPRACGEPMPDGLWQGWIEFLGSDGSVLRTDRETTQPNRSDLAYWASGLSDEYLEGALDRALNPVAIRREPEILPPQAPPPRANPRHPPLDPTRAVLDPFSVYAQGEDILRRELSALSRDHLRNILQAYALDGGRDWTGATESELSAAIVTAVRERAKNTRR